MKLAELLAVQHDTAGARSGTDVSASHVAHLNGQRMIKQSGERVSNDSGGSQTRDCNPAGFVQPNITPYHAEHT